jgi:hypothetical protein
MKKKMRSNSRGEMPSTPSPIYIKSSDGGKRLNYHCNINTPLRGNLGKM